MLTLKKARIWGILEDLIVEYGVYDYLIIIYPKAIIDLLKGDYRVLSGVNRHGNPWMVVLVESGGGLGHARCS